METNTEFLTVKDIQELLHVSRRTVYRWIETGKIESIRTGKKHLFRKQDILDLLNPDNHTDNHADNH